LPNIPGFISTENSELHPLINLNLLTIHNMASTPTTIDLMSLEASASPSKSFLTLPNAFSQMMHGKPVEQKKDLRD
jgi:hypothetical protein